MTLEVELYFSFRSPYSFLATPSLREIVQRYDVEFTVRPVLPLAVRDHTFFSRVNPLWPRYVFIDTSRIAQAGGIEYSWPNPDPVVYDPEQKRAADHQPYIHRLTRLGVCAEERGRGLPFICEVSQTIFGGTRDWHTGDHLERAATRAGLDLLDLDRAVEAEPGSYDRKIEENQKSLEAAGHWGVPTAVFRGEPFFGQDRLELLVWRLKQHGLESRASG
ncbi:MAG: DsbA family protein [Myxococcota bacterium]